MKWCFPQRVVIMISTDEVIDMEKRAECCDIGSNFCINSEEREIRSVGIKNEKLDLHFDFDLKECVRFTPKDGREHQGNKP